MRANVSRPKRILLTGGIASGKTFISDFLGNLGANVVDTDFISRTLTANDNAPGRAALREIQALFGEDVVDCDLNLHRAKMRELIFNDDEKKRALEAILHPRILAETERQLAEFEATSQQVGEAREQGKQYSLIVVPIIHEKSPYLKLADEVLVVETDYATQVERIMARDGNDRELAEKIIAAQIPRLERRKLGHKIIINRDKAHVERYLARLDEVYSEPLAVTNSV